MELNEKVRRSLVDEDARDALIREYRPFIAKTASRFAGRFIDGHDDEMSTAMIAFDEALRRYRPDDGDFIPFAARVMRSRLIDEARRAGRAVATVPLEPGRTGDDREEGDPAELSAAPAAEDPVKLEIDALTQALSRYGCSFSDVARCSPRSKKTKKACGRAAAALLGSPDMMASLTDTCQLPAARVAETTGVSRKTLGRHRNYIVSLVEILSGEYPCLAEYVQFVREETP